MNDTKPNYQVPNLDRALSMIELLSQNPKGLTLTEIMESLDVSKNSVFRISMTLLQRGYILRDDKSKRFSLSRKLLTLGNVMPDGKSLVELSMDVMREMRDEIKETVLFGTLIENEGVVLAQVPGSHAFKFTVDVGTRFMFHTAAPAKAILPFLPKADLEKHLKSMKFPKFTKNTITTLKNFRKVIEEAKINGYAIDDHEEMEGMVCIAAPIFNNNNLPIASIWFTGPSARIHQEDYQQYGKQVLDFADRISDRLGYVKAI